MRICTIIAIFCAICSPLMATQWFCASGGSDANNGTSSGTPFLTPTNTSSHAGVNDTLSFNGGDIFTLPQNASMTAKNGQTYNSYGTGMAKIIGGTNLGCLNITNLSNITLSNIWWACVYSDTNANKSGGIYYNNYFVGLFATTSSNTKYTNFSMINCIGTGSTEGLWMQAPTTNLADGFYYGTIKGCTFSNITENAFAPFANDDDSSYALGTNPMQFGYWYIGHNMFNHIDGDGIAKGGGTPVEIFNCTAFLLEWNTNINCTLSNHYANGLVGGGPAGFFPQTCTFITNQYSFYYNIQSRIDNNGMAQDGDGRGFDVSTAYCLDQYNYTQGCQGPGIYNTGVGGFSNVIRYNIDITNNTLINTGANNRQGFDISLGQVSSCQIYGNTVLTASNILDTSQSTGTITVTNNIFYTSFPSFGSFANTSFGNNLFLTSPPSWLNSQWQVAYGSPAFRTAVPISNDGGFDYYGQPLSTNGQNIGAVQSAWGIPVFMPFYAPTNSP